MEADTKCTRCCSLWYWGKFCPGVEDEEECERRFEPIEGQEPLEDEETLAKYVTEFFPAITEMEVTVGTTGPMGGDVGHGGYTYITLKDLTAADWEIEITNKWEYEDGFREPISIDLRYCDLHLKMSGDSEGEGFIKQIEWAALTLRKLWDQAEQEYEQKCEQDRARRLEGEKEKEMEVKGKVVGIGLDGQKLSGVVRVSPYANSKIHGWGIFVVGGVAIPMTFCGDGITSKATYLEDNEPLTCEDCKMTARRLGDAEAILILSEKTGRS